MIFNSALSTSLFTIIHILYCTYHETYRIVNLGQ
jgi:hypothetical protein